MLNKLYNKLNNHYEIEKPEYINGKEYLLKILKNEKEIHIYDICINNKNYLNIYLFDNNECIESEIFDNEAIAYYHIRGLI